KGKGFTVITVALDKTAEDARPWIEKASPAHPSLIDTRHVLADLYNVVNVPTIFWIDERGRIVRPNDVAFGTDTFKHITGLESARWDRSSARCCRAGSAAASRITARCPTPPASKIEQGGLIAWACSTARRRWSPAPGAASDAASRWRWRRPAPRWW